MFCKLIIELAVLLAAVHSENSPVCHNSSVSGGAASFEWPRFDGWFNNLDRIAWGSAGQELSYPSSPRYADRTYEMDKSASVRELSDAFRDETGRGSLRSLTALVPYFGRFLWIDLVDAEQPACPVELLRHRSLSDDPYLRSVYNRDTGHSPNQPRRTMNLVTSWLDASGVYSSSPVWANCLRAFSLGKLHSSNFSGDIPGANAEGLPLVKFPAPGINDFVPGEELWKVGDARSHEHPGVLSVALVWFRYHNLVAQRLKTCHKDWTDPQLFMAARSRVIAQLQSTVLYEWLPALLAVPTKPYSGYRPHLLPSVSVAFESVALPYLYTLMPPALLLRQTQSCQFEPSPLRMCNHYWNGYKEIEKRPIGRFIGGAIGQLAEREDMHVVSDVREYWYGPYYNTRKDAVAEALLRARDHGLSDYDGLREDYELKRTGRKVDGLSGAMREIGADGIPGELLSAIWTEQMLRTRDSDRMWFENVHNKLFTREEIDEIRRTKFSDVIKETTRISHVQRDVFFLGEGDSCRQEAQLDEDQLEACTKAQHHDYFAGSEIPYIMIVVSIVIFPFACICVGYLSWACWTRVRISRSARDKPTFRESFRRRRRQLDASGLLAAMEQPELDSAVRPVYIRFVWKDCVVDVLSEQQKPLRSIDLRRQDEHTLLLAQNRGRLLLVLKVLKEYDLILRLYSPSEQHYLISNFTRLLEANGCQLHVETVPEGLLKRQIVTKRKRQKMLVEFFQNVFAEAYESERPVGETRGDANPALMKDCELSRAEFAESLALKPDSFFVNQMFELIDQDNNGFISFRELLYAVLLFTKGSKDDKLSLLFRMYNVNKSGTMPLEEVYQLIRSILEMANTKLEADQVEKLTNEMLASSGLQNREFLGFEEFKQLLSDAENISLDWKGAAKGARVYRPGSVNHLQPPSDRPVNSPISPAARNVAGLNMQQREPNKKQMVTRMAYNKLGYVFNTCQHFMQNQKQHIICVFLFLCTNCLLFAERFYRYAVEKEHIGVRSLTGWGLSVTRGAAASMSFSYSLLLLTMCRNFITVLRETILNRFIPFDSMVAFHKLVAYTALLFTVVHVFGYFFNFYQIATQPPGFLCVFDFLQIPYNFRNTFAFWIFQNMTGLTGYLLVVCVSVLFVFASQTARTHIFRLFWTTHRLFYLMYLLIVLHGANRVVQEPMFWQYFLVPAVLFSVDKIVALSRRKLQLLIRRVEHLPSETVLIEFTRPASFEYKSGQWVRIACVELSKDEYHPFTLTSAPNEDRLSVHIRAVGPWTRHVKRLLEQDESRPKLYIDGPYGAGQQDWYKFDVSILVGGGIGVTPSVSILKDFVFMSQVRNTFRLRCKKLYFVWVTGSHKNYEWVIDILRQVEEADDAGRVEIHIFITQFFHQFDLRTTMLYICEEHFKRMSSKSLFTGLQAKTYFGRPNFDNILEKISEQHSKVRNVGVFSCGPPGLTKGVEKACYDVSSKTKAHFQHHFENF